MKYELRNISKVSDTEIILEWNHPVYGWIPYTAVANSGEKDMDAIFKQAIKSDPEYDLSYLKNRIIYKAKRETEIDNSKYTKEEIDSFATKRIEAEKVILGQSSKLIEAEASFKKVAPRILAEKIVEKNNAAVIDSTFARLKAEKIESDLISITSYDELVQYMEKAKNG